MKILVLGGTVFLGRVLAESALLRGHELTLFNRGQSGPDLFPEAEHLRGDRRADLSALEDRRWDAVIDTCGYLPGEVRSSARLLAPAVGSYVFVSTISVYADFSQPGLTEDAPVAQMPEGSSRDEFSGEAYGALKALCEQEVLEACPDSALIIRPGLIVGRYDRTDRFTYWPWRIAQGGEVLAPGEPATPIQFIDVRDLAEWTLNLAEQTKTGVIHATGPDQSLPMGALLETCRQVSANSVQFTWVSESFLKNHSVQPWSELPAWLPASDPETAGLMQVDLRRALESGLTFRPLVDTVEDTLAWASSRGPAYVLRAGLTREREADLLRLWRERSR